MFVDSLPKIRSGNMLKRELRRRVEALHQVKRSPPCTLRSNSLAAARRGMRGPPEVQGPTTEVAEEQTAYIRIERLAVLIFSTMQR